MSFDVSMYVIVCSAVIVFLVNENQTIFEFIRIRKNASVFSEIDVSTFFNHENNDHVIDLMQNKKSFFESLYNMSQTKLKILAKYIRKNLIFDRIREFTSSAITSILFIFKKNEKLQLCVNYRNLNAITIKNRHSLFLIEETLNRLMKTRYFIKLNLKDVYYRIRIKKRNE